MSSSSEPASKKPSTMSPPRPSLGSRQQSGSMIVPSNHPEIECKTPREFPPDDARAMSPRQSTENLDQMCGESRDKIQSSAIEHQAGLAALVEKIESVKTGHEKLERDNNALQEYIGGLTKSMSKTDLTSGRKK
ncbi:MAG: hypothetical protein OHK93_001330 [Ramalina farinacea]|uniref:BZIP transcription factor n=1 Tax=Ramalina farinacea TaxID=258253 RepID=A0AA43QTM9_9LECA|nr:hypothetical protein [Ramalina farinacea]